MDHPSTSSPSRLGRIASASLDALGLIVGMLSLARMTVAIVESLCLPNWLHDLLWSWDELAEFLFSQLHAWFVRLVEWLTQITHWRLELHDHWKYVAMMVWIYTMKDAKNALESDWEGHRLTAVVRGTWGGMLALVFGFIGGLVLMNDPSQNALVAASLVGAIFLYRVAWAFRYREERRQENIRRNAGHDLGKDLRDKLVVALAILVVGLAIVALCAFSDRLRVLDGFASPGLAALIGIVLSLAGFHAALALRNAFQRRRPDETLLAAFLRQGNFRLSAMIAPSLLGPFAVTVFGQCAVQGVYG